jgi:hypothetical protein
MKGTTIHCNSRLELIHLPCAIQDHQVNAFGITQQRPYHSSCLPLITIFQVDGFASFAGQTKRQGSQSYPAFFKRINGINILPLMPV